MRNNVTRKLTVSAVIAALYAVLTLILPMLSYGPVQIRFSEALTILPFFIPEAIPGLTVGCFIANVIGSPMPIDWLLGTAATMLAALLTYHTSHKWLAPLPPVICNALIIGAEIAWFETGLGSGFALAFAYNALTVGLGELIACYALGMLLIRYLPRIATFRDMIPENRRNRL